MRISPTSKKVSYWQQFSLKTVRKYHLSSFRLLLIAVFSTALGGLLVLSNIPGYLKANFVVMTHPEAIASLLSSNNFDEMRLDIKFKNFRKIADKREDALKLGLLISSDNDFVPGQVSVNDTSVPCKLRLKGDLSDHWETDKWSFRVRVKGEQNIFGMTSFSLQHPVTRGNSSQWLYLQSLRREKLLAVDYKFVNLTINGKKMGVYAMEEHFSKELMETQNKREGIILSFDEYRFWKNLPPRQGNVEWASAYQSTTIKERNSNRINKLPLLRKQKIIAVNLIRNLQEKKLEGHEIFEPNKLGRFLAISRLWNAEHGLQFHNVNFYFDPISNRLEPIGFDGLPGDGIIAPHCYFSGGWIPDNWVNQALRSPHIAKAYIKHLDLITRPNHIDALIEDLEEEELRIRRILFREIFLESDNLIWKSDSSLLTYQPWKVLKERAKAIRKELNEERPAIAYARPFNKNKTTLEVVVRNALTQPIEILGFEKGERKWRANETINSPKVTQIDPTGQNIVMPLQRFGHTSLDGDHVFLLNSYFDNETSKDNLDPDKSLNLIVRILGLDNKKHLLPIPVDSSRFKPEKLLFRSNFQYTLSKHPFLNQYEDKIFINPGKHEVTENLIIPPHRFLEIPAGTTLCFANNTRFVSESPIRAYGTEEKPIQLTAAEGEWQGLLVNNAHERSILQHVRIGKMGKSNKTTSDQELAQKNWTLTGGVTFYDSPVEISHCLFEDVQCEDALNIVSSDFNMNYSVFSKISSDAFDGDFVNGEITNCVFEKIGGDAVDLSGSKITIDNVRIVSTKDKAISAGEDSRLILSHSMFEDVGFGIASKDLSQVIASDIQIKRASVAAIAAYQKKSLFGPSKITAERIKVSETSNLHLIEKGSSARINGAKIEGIELDVDLLYSNPQKPI